MLYPYVPLGFLTVKYTVYFMSAPLLDASYEISRYIVGLLPEPHTKLDASDVAIYRSPY